MIKEIVTFVILKGRLLLWACPTKIHIVSFLYFILPTSHPRPIFPLYHQALYRSIYLFILPYPSPSFAFFPLIVQQKLRHFFGKRKSTNEAADVNLIKTTGT